MVAAARSAAACEASSGRGEVDTPSQTTATTDAGPAESSAMASSLRLCRRPRSLTPAEVSSSISTWSRPVGWSMPQFSQ